MTDTLYIGGYILVYPYLGGNKKKEKRVIKTNFYNKYLLCVNKFGNIIPIFVSRVHMITGYELVKYSKRSNFFKLCRSVFGVKSQIVLEYSGVEPNDLIGHYITRKSERKFVKAPKNTIFSAEVASYYISFLNNTRNSLVYLEDKMIKNFIKSRSITLWPS